MCIQNNVVHSSPVAVWLMSRMFITKSTGVGFFSTNVRHAGPLFSTTVYVPLLKHISTSNQKHT